MANNIFWQRRIKPFRMIFLIKVGEKIECNKIHCYRVYKLIDFFFSLYYSGAFLFVIFIIFHYIDTLLENSIISLVVSLILYMALEIATALIVPMKRVDCDES